MARKERLVVSLTWFLMVAFVVMSLSMSVSASARLQTVEHMAHPQGCRCCWFIWKPQIKCGQVCCGDRCCQ